VIGFGSAFWLGEVTNPRTFILYIFIVFVLSLDILISFHRGFYRVGKGKVIGDRKAIRMNYIKGFLSIDIISTM
jgi:uncharacterized membrane protein